MSYVSDWSNPGKLVKSLGMPFWGNLKPTAGDIACFFSLFFDNLSTMVTFSAIWLFVVGGSADILYGRIVPGCGLALFLGNVYYSWMATRMKTQFGRDFTAQPYGINTVGGFPFLFGVMGPIVWGGGTVEDAWKAGCTGNFIVGLINLLIGVAFTLPGVGNFLLKVTPIAALMIPVAGVGITFLAINQIAQNFATPVAGFIPVLMIFMMYYSGAPIKVCGKRIPEVFHWIVPGYILGWVYRIVPAAAPGWSYSYPGGGLWVGGAFVEGFEAAGSAIGTILPIAIVASAGDIMSLVSAYNAGDPYPIGETLISDGFLTIIGSIFGSPFGTVIYFGHPVHKMLGGKYFFSFFNGVVYLILTLAGLFPLILDITPAVAAGPTIMIFGLMLCEECTRVLPQRHHCIIFFSLFFSWANYMSTIGAVAQDAVGKGIGVMNNGYLLSAMLWSAMLAYAIDRRYIAAAAVSVVAAVFAFFGLIHLGLINFDLLMTGAQTGGNNLWPEQADEPRYSSSPFQCAMGYLTMTACFVLWHILQTTFPDQYPQPLYQGTPEAEEADKLAKDSKQFTIGSFDNWWAKGAGDLPTKTTEAAQAATA